jgi:predicted GNAT family N-acyltransferase
MKVREISAQDTIQIRHEVLRKNKPIETCSFIGDNLKSTYHIGVFFDAVLVGICTLIKKEKAIQQKLFSYQLRGMAVLEAYQGQRAARQLMEFLPEFLKTKEISHIWCNARLTAVSFYVKYGFETDGIPFEIPEVGSHLLMYTIYE